MKLAWTWMVCCLLMEAESLSLDQSTFLTSFMIKKMFEEGQNVFTACRRDLYRMATQSNEAWALKMLDATSKPGSGLLLGHRAWGGSHDLCLSTVAPSSNSVLNGQGFTGQYCWITWEIIMKGRIKVPLVNSAVCLPSSCGSEDGQNFFPFVAPLIGLISPMMKDVTETVRMKSASCSEETISWNTYTILTLVILISITCLAVLGTLRDSGSSDDWTQRTPKKKQSRCANLRHKSRIVRNQGKISIYWDLILCFSLRRNTAAILNTEERDPKLSFLHGLRVISICWIVFGHIGTHFAQVERNVIELFMDARNPLQQFRHLGFYAVDTFFFISAFLLGLNILSNTSFRLTARASVFIIVNRYIRTAPSMLVTIVIYVFIMKPQCRGQLWFLNEETVGCHAIWWSFPLYMQNLFHELFQCLTYLWYLAADFQLFLVSLPVLMFFQRFRRMGTTVILLLMLSSCIFGFVTEYSQRMKTFYDHACLSVEQPMEAMQLDADVNSKAHFLPHIRGGAYWAGLLFALSYAKHLKSKSKMNSSMCRCVLQALLACVFFLFVILFPSLTSRGDLTTALYLSTCRVVWAIGLVLLFDLCLKNPKCVLSRFLSWRGWRILSRMSYSLYLLHVLLISYVVYSRDRMATYSNNHSITMLFGVLTFCFPICFVFSLLFEAPFINLGKLMAERKV